MTAEPAIRSAGAYPCPHCQAVLEDRTGRASGWLRCPKCGRAGRVPDRGRVPPQEVASAGDGVIFLDDPPSPRTMTPVGVTWPLSYLSENGERPGGAARVVYAAALFVSLTLLGVMLWEGKTYGVTVSIGAAILSLGMLVRSARW